MADTDTFLKSSFGWLELKNYSADPTDVETTRNGLCFVSGVLKQYTSSAWSNVGSGSSAATWDEMYANDKSLTVSSTTLTFAGTYDADVITITGNADVDTGALLQFASTGDAKDIQGTGDTWNISKTGYFTGVRVFASGYVSTASAADLTLHTNSGTNSSKIVITDGVNGDITCTLNGTGAFKLAGTTEANNQLEVDTGDVAVADGSISITDDDNAASLTVTNTATFTQTTSGVVTIVADSATTGNIVDINGDAMTSGSVIHLDVTGATFTGEYIDCTDGGTSEFKVMRYGATTIRGQAAGTDALTISLGDLEITDSDANQISSVDGTSTLLTLDNEGGAIGSGAAVLSVDAGGVVNAAGYGIYAAFTGAAAAGATVVGILPDAGGVGLKILGGGVVTQRAVDIDADPTAHDVVYIHSDAVIASDCALINLNSAGDIASGGNIFRVDAADSEPASGAIYVEFDFAGITDTNENIGLLIDAGGKAVQALKIDADPTTGDVAHINCDSVIAADKGALQIVTTGDIAAGGTAMRFDVTGTPDADARVLEFDLAAVTDTAEPYAIFIDAGGKKVRALHIDADPVTNDVVYIHSDAIIAADKGMLRLDHATGVTADGAALLRITESAAGHTGSMALEIDAQNDSRAIYVDSDAATNHAVHIIGSGDIAADKALLCVESNATALVADSALVRIQDSGSAAGAGATVYGLIINMDGTNLEGLWVEKGTSTFAEAITVSAGGASITGTVGLDGAVTINDSSADVDFRVETDSSQYALEVNGGNNNVSINATGVSAHYDLALLGDGVLCIKEGATPTADTNYGKVYCKNDNKLYFQDGAGTEHEIAYA